MGTDIHMVVQVKRGGSWEIVDAPAWLVERDDYDKKYGRWCSDRNYDAFAILADVRNGSGFAGVETGEVMIPVAGEGQRGLPPDLDGVNTDYDTPFHSLGDHSFHWLSLRELAEYPHWDKQRLHYGVVLAKWYVEHWKGKPVRVNDGPKEYCGATFGGGVRTFEEAEFLALGEAAPVDANANVRISWPETYAYSAGSWYTEFLPALRRWADENKVAYEDVRIVMGFDS